MKEDNQACPAWSGDEVMNASEFVFLLGVKRLAVLKYQSR